MFCTSGVASVGGAEVFGVCATSMMSERSGAVSVAVHVAGGLVEAPPPSCSCPQKARLSMTRCVSSAFLPLQFRPFACSTIFMSAIAAFALSLSPVPYNVYRMHEYALLVSGPGGIGPLMAPAAMRLHHLDFRIRHLDISRSRSGRGHQFTHRFPISAGSRPDSAWVFPICPSCSQFTYVPMMWHPIQKIPAT